MTLERYGRLQFLTNYNYCINALQVDNLPLLYVDVLKQLKLTKYSTRSWILLTFEQIIWNNQKILINGKLVFYKSWFDQNIIRFTDPSREREIPVL